MYKNIFKNKKAIVFDLDGTLVETHSLWEKAFINIMNKANLSVAKFGNVTEGLSIIEKWKEILLEFESTDDHLNNLVNMTIEEFLKLFEKDKPKIIEGFYSFIFETKIQRNFRLAIATNSPRKALDGVLKLLDISHLIDDSVAGDEVTHTKPNPEIYRKLLKKMGLKAKEVVVFEDSVPGTTAAIKAGLDTFVVFRNKVIFRFNYPEEVIQFIPDLSVFENGFDYTPREYYETIINKIVKKQKQSKNNHTNEVN